jgi:hypothetical protein
LSFLTIKGSLFLTEKQKHARPTGKLPRQIPSSGATYVLRSGYHNSLTIRDVKVGGDADFLLTFRQKARQ